MLIPDHPAAIPFEIGFDRSQQTEKTICRRWGMLSFQKELAPLNRIKSDERDFVTKISLRAAADPKYEAKPAISPHRVVSWVFAVADFIMNKRLAVELVPSALTKVWKLESNCYSR